MTDDEQICLQAESEDDKPLFILGVLRIADHKGIDILKNRGCFCKRDSVLLPVRQILLRILFKMQHLHNYIIIILCGLSIDRLIPFSRP